MNWTDEDRAALKRLAAEGKSASAIAEATGRSRSAVCAQAHRLGVRLLGQAGAARNAASWKNRGRA